MAINGQKTQKIQKSRQKRLLMIQNRFGVVRSIAHRDLRYKDGREEDYYRPKAVQVHQ